MLMSRVKPSQSKIAADKIKEKKIKRAQQYSCLCQCTDWLSSTQNGQGVAGSFSTLHGSNPFLGQVINLLEFTSTAVHRIRLGTSCFVPMPNFYSETNEWSKDEWSNAGGFGQQQLLAKSNENFRFFSPETKSVSSLPEIYKALNPFLLSNWVSITRVLAWFPQVNLLWPAATAAD